MAKELSFQVTDFDSHLLTGDDIFFNSSGNPPPDFDSHLLTGDDKNSLISSFEFGILTHISSPEMTLRVRYAFGFLTNFDSHLLTGDDRISSLTLLFRT